MALDCTTRSPGLTCTRQDSPQGVSVSKASSSCIGETFPTPSVSLVAAAQRRGKPSERRQARMSRRISATAFD
jgi:hypothetical protein